MNILHGELLPMSSVKF